MSRKLERTLLMIGSGWNMIVSLITIFGYSTWFRNAGIQRITNNGKNIQFNSRLLDNITLIIMVFGLLILVGALFNVYVAWHIQDGEIQKKVMIWMIIWGIVNLISCDPIGFGIYLITFVMYYSRNKSIKLVKSIN